MKILSRMLRPLRAQTPLFLLVLIAVTVAVANFDSKTWLTGWDTLHPEFNFSLNFTRLLSGVWREDQGLGAVAAHTHMADLPRVAILWLLTFIAPLHTVKKLYVLACVVIGPLGIYNLVEYALRKYARTASIISRYTALITAAWYLFNLGTVQHFYVVFEMFAVQYAAIGWLFYFAIRYLEQRNIRDLGAFSLVSIAAAPMAYASTLWFAYAGGLGLTILTIWILQPSRDKFFRSVYLGLVVFGTNAFWLLPNLYFLFSGASDNPKYAHINELFSVEAFLQNKAFGTIEHVALLRNFLFNWSIFSQASGRFEPLMQVWIAHINYPGIILIGYACALLLLFGLVQITKSRFQRIVGFIPAWIAALFMLINENPPFTAIFSWLRQQSSFFEEGLRFPFTKFSILFMLTTTVIIAPAIAIYLEKMKSLLGKKYGIRVIPFSAFFPIVLLIFFGLPMLRGELITAKLHQNIPDAYFELFEFFESQPPETRVLQLPMQTLHGWDYYNWGYEGPGFVWFGIPQPYLVRDFDRWNAQNETLYKQFSTALYALDTEQVRNTLQKYDIGFVVIDGSITAPQSKSQAVTWVGESRRMLQALGAEEVWTDEYLSVYKIPNAPENFITSHGEYSPVHAEGRYTHYDPVFDLKKQYVSFSNQLHVLYPFAGMLQDRPSISFDSSRDLLISGLPSPEFASNLVIPKLSVGEYLRVRVAITTEGNSTIATFFPTAYVKRGNDTYPIAHLPQLELISDELVSTSQVFINNQEFIVTDNNSSVEGYVTLQIGAPIELQVVSPQNEVTFQQYPGEIWNSLLVDQKFLLDEKDAGKPLELLITKPETNNYLGDLLSAQELNCDIYQRGQTHFGGDQLRNSIDLRAAEKGAVCIGAELAPYSNQLLHIVGENISGRSLKIYIENEQNQRIELERLLGSGQYEQVFTILQNATGATNDRWLSLENRSVAGELSRNSVSLAQSYSLPHSFQYLSTIYVEPIAALPKIESVSVINSKKITPTLYTAQIVPKNNASIPLLTLSQAYDKGWIAIEKGTWPAILDHTTVNGWMNGWIVPNTTQNSSVRTVYLYFLPQVLELFGLSILLLSILWSIYVLFVPKYSLPSRHLLASRRIKNTVKKILK